MDGLTSTGVRGILKNTGKSGSITGKTAKFDELNIMETFHPLNKDYGHMIIDEPKTPFVFEEELPRDLDTEALMEKLRLAAQSETPAFGMDDDSDDSSDDDDYPESVEENVRRLEFERRRKLHYKEFQSVPLARRLIAEEFADIASSDVSISDEMDKMPSSCLSEVCPTYDSHTAPEPSISSVSATNLTINSDEIAQYVPPEPGFHPSHKCYQKLMAERHSVHSHRSIASTASKSHRPQPARPRSPGTHSKHSAFKFT